MVTELVESYVITMSDLYIQNKVEEYTAIYLADNLPTLIETYLDEHHKVEEYTAIYLADNLPTLIETYLDEHPCECLPFGETLPTLPSNDLLFYLQPPVPSTWGIYINAGDSWEAITEWMQET
jgi:hypothetical protein